MSATRRFGALRKAQAFGARGAATRLAWPGVALLLAACSTPGSEFSVLPGPGKDQAAFQQDMLICQRDAIAHTGYNTPLPPVSVPPATAPPQAPPPAAADEPANIAAGPSAPGPAQPLDEAGYLQCMASRGDTVQAEPSAYADQFYPNGDFGSYDYPWGGSYGYPGGWGNPGPVYDGGLFGGFAFGFGGDGYHRWDHDHWDHDHGRFGTGMFGHGRLRPLANLATADSTTAASGTAASGTAASGTAALGTAGTATDRMRFASPVRSSRKRSSSGFRCQGDRRKTDQVDQ